eukprot:GGOE01006533.1.p1 GENE.GGOE01006533.1~~GGOE01006533.1.p1  ORF type:complete len:186 (+),score=2.92 GGOE01006533.1:8-565(+)
MKVDIRWKMVSWAMGSLGEVAKSTCQWVRRPQRCASPMLQVLEVHPTCRVQDTVKKACQDRSLQYTGACMAHLHRDVPCGLRIAGSSRIEAAAEPGKSTRLSAPQRSAHPRSTVSVVWPAGTRITMDEWVSTGEGGQLPGRDGNPLQPKWTKWGKNEYGTVLGGRECSAAEKQVWIQARMNHLDH